MRPNTTIGILTLLALAGWPAGSTFAERNLFEWVAVAPVVVAADILGENGKYTEIRALKVLRGELATAGPLRVDVTHANRNRDRSNQQRSLQLDPEIHYLLLLEPAPARGRKDLLVYNLVRGVLGARELPAEGSDSTISALESLIEIQDRKSEALTWDHLGELLEDSNPILLENAMDQFLKFQRGTLDHLESLRPLLDHPGWELRLRAAQLIGQILGRADDLSQAETRALQTDLIARARRDSEVSVRVAATEALHQLPGSGVLGILNEIAADDPDQNVRYAAECLLYERRLQQKVGDSGRSMNGGPN